MPSGIYKRTKIYRHTEETKQKIRAANLGKKQSYELVEKRIAPLRGKKRPSFSEKWKKNMSESHKGYKPTEEARKNMSKNNARYFLGKHHSEESRKKLSESHLGKSILKNQKEKHWNWRGGLSYEPYSVDWTQTLKKSIKERDFYTCQECKSQPELLHIHHIDYDKKNCNPDNLITLCPKCHTKTNKNRDYWVKYFKGQIIISNND